MIIVTWPVFVRIYQCGAESVFELLPDKVDIYRKTHDYLFEYPAKFVFNGKGREYSNRLYSGHGCICEITLYIILLM